VIDGQGKRAAGALEQAAAERVGGMGRCRISQHLEDEGADLGVSGRQLQDFGADDAPTVARASDGGGRSESDPVAGRCSAASVERSPVGHVLELCR
jgi:hypothetical protein